MIRDHAVKVLKKDEFIEQLRSTRSASLRIGVFDGTQLVAVAYFGFPESDGPLDRYVCELKDFVTLSDVASADMMNLIISFYKKRSASTDLFIYEDAFGAFDPFLLPELGVDPQGRSYRGWSNPNRSFYSYIITASDSDKYYIGISHLKKANASENDCLLDDYWGSGGKKFAHWKAKHLSKLSKTVISIHDRKSEVGIEEALLVGDLYRTDPLCLNSTAGGSVQGPQTIRSPIVKSECLIHGQTAHLGSSCISCRNSALVSIQTCAIHGDTKHSGQTCMKCSAAKMVVNGCCEIHGEVKLQWGVCYICRNQEVLTEAVCDIHGSTIHRGTTCFKCTRDASTSTRLCNEHGSTIFNGESCMKCAAKSAVKLAICSIHGESKHRGPVCLKCNIDNAFSDESCPKHGETKFRNGHCLKCIAGSTEKECPRHGMSLHRGSNCAKCGTEKSRCTRYHKDISSTDCYYCQHPEEHPGKLRRIST